MGILVCILKCCGILIHTLKFWASMSVKRSGILYEVAEGRELGMFLFTAALLMALWPVHLCHLINVMASNSSD
jgi:hypothetical protein